MPDDATKAQIEFTPADDFVAKADDQQVVWGWASVISEKGEPVVDSQGDVISEADLVKAAHGFVSDTRAGKVMHQGRRIADVVESVVLTADLQKALGVDLGRVGWLVAMRVHDADVWKRVRDGELRAFSIGGSAMRTEAAA